MIDDSREFWFTARHLFIFPGVMIALALLVLNFIGDGLRENWTRASVHLKGRINPAGS